MLLLMVVHCFSLFSPIFYIISFTTSRGKMRVKCPRLMFSSWVSKIKRHSAWPMGHQQAIEREPGPLPLRSFWEKLIWWMRPQKNWLDINLALTSGEPWWRLSPYHMLTYIKSQLQPFSIPLRSDLVNKIKQNTKIGLPNFCSFPRKAPWTPGQTLSEQVRSLGYYQDRTGQTLRTVW